jgi:ankyrin repeat protein
MEEILNKMLVSKKYKEGLKEINIFKNYIERKFIDLCSEGKLEEAKKLYYDNNFIDINSNNIQAFESACDNGHLELAKWLYSEGASIEANDYRDEYAGTPYSQYKVFVNASRSDENRIEILEWLLSLNENYGWIFLNQLNGFENACKDNKIDIIYLIMKSNTNPSITQLNFGFVEACRHGNIDIAKYLLELDCKPEISIDNDKHNPHLKEYINDSFLKASFDFACIRGYLDVAKWLYTLDNNSLSNSKFNNLFKKICYYTENIDVIKYIYDIAKPNIELLNECFYISCIQNHINIAKYILDLGCDLNLSFYHVEYKYHTKFICKYKTLLDNTFYNVCIRGYLDIMKWLYEIDHDLIQRIVNDELLKSMDKYFKNDNIVKQWILSLNN